MKGHLNGLSSNGQKEEVVRGGGGSDVWIEAFLVEKEVVLGCTGSQALTGRERRSRRGQCGDLKLIGFDFEEYVDLAVLIDSAAACQR